MKSNEFLKEGVDTSPEDVQQNHPDIYEFITNTTGPYTIQKAKVQSFNLGKKHFVVLKMGPTAGIQNTMRIFKDAGIDFNYNETMNTMSGVHNGLPFTISEDHVYGNKTQTWTFELAIKEEAVAEAGTSHRGHDNEQWGVFHTGSQHGQNNPNTYAPVDHKIYPSKDHAIAAAQRSRKEKIPGGRQSRGGIGFSVRRIKPKDLLNMELAKYNAAHFREGGSRATLTGPNKVTVMSLDDGQPQFIGTGQEFQKYANQVGEEIEWPEEVKGGHPDEDDWGDDDDDDFDAWDAEDYDDDDDMPMRRVEAAQPKLSPVTQKFLDSNRGNVKKALKHAKMAQEMGRDLGWFPVIRELKALLNPVKEDNAEQDYYGAKAVHDRYPTQRRGDELAKLKQNAGLPDMSQSPENKAARAKMYSDQGKKDREGAKYAVDKIKGIFK